MATSFKLTFEGLCAFADRANAVEVYLLSGHGPGSGCLLGHVHADHGACLVIRTDFIKVDAKTSWKPDRVGLIRDFDESSLSVEFRQVGIWFLTGEDVTITAAAGKPEWEDLKQTRLNFQTLHTTPTVLTRADIEKKDAAVGIIALQGKDTTLVPLPPTTDDKFAKVPCKGGTSIDIGPISRLVQWQVLDVAKAPTIVNVGKKTQIEFRDLLTSCYATISNVAPVLPSEGLTHFDHYYETVTPVKEEFLKIENKFADVYDCVPPASLS